MNSITLDSISPNEWAQIKKEALIILNSGGVGRDEFRSTVIGFVVWLMKNNKILEFEVAGPKDRVH